MANQQMKRYSTLYVIRALQITTVRYCYILIKMSKIPNIDNTSAGEDAKLSFIAGGNAK